MNNVIHCIGNSHAGFFTGKNAMRAVWPQPIQNTIPCFKAYPLGAVLAYTLPNATSTLRGRERLFELLDTLPTQSTLLFCFGEIDCRVHLLKQATEQRRPVETVVRECVERYVSVLAEIQQRGFQVMVWGVIPSTPSETAIHPLYPHYGSCLERNNVTRIFNNLLQENATSHAMPFLSVFDALLLPNGLTNGRFLSDGVHLSQKAMPLAISELRKQVSTFPVRLFYGRFLTALPAPLQWTLFVCACEFKTFVFHATQNTIAATKKSILFLFGEALPRKIKSALTPRADE